MIAVLCCAVRCHDGLQVIGKLSGNHKASISCLLTLPSKAAWKSVADAQAAAGVQQQEQQQKTGKDKRRKAEPAEPPPEFIPTSDLLFAGTDQHRHPGGQLCSQHVTCTAVA